MSNHTTNRAFKRGWVSSTIIALLLTSFVATTFGFGIYLFSTILTDIKAELGFSYTTAGLIMACTQLGFLVFSLLGSVIASVIGGGCVLLGSVALCGISLIGVTFTHNIWMLAALLTVMGGCAASVYVAMVEFVSRFIGFQHRSKVLGLASSGTSYGVFLNGFIVPLFIIHHNWRAIWLFVGTVTLLLTAVGYFTFSKLKVLEQPRASSEHSGTLTPSYLRKFLSPQITTIWAITFLIGFASFPFQNYLTPFLRDDLGVSISTAGQIWAIIGCVGMGAGFAIGALSERTGIRAALVLTYLCVVLSTLLLCLHSNETVLLAAGVAFGFGFYPIFGLVPTYISKTFPTREATILFGLANLSEALGSILGNFLGGWSKTETSSFLWIYVTIGIVALLSIALTLSLPNESKSSKVLKHRVN